MDRDRPPTAPSVRLLANPVTVIVVCAVGLTILGLTILYSASGELKEGPYYYMSKQVIGVCGAVVLCLLASRVDLDYLRRYAWGLAGGLVLLLLLVLNRHIGISAGGGRRWLGHGSVRLQVSEFAKIGMVFCLAHYLALQQTRLGNFKLGFLYPLALILAFVGPIMKEPDYGAAALTLGVGMVVLVLAGAKWRYLLPTVALAGLVFAVAVMRDPVHRRRFTAFLDVEGNKQSGTYQLYQSETAFAAGGIDGVGFGQGRQQDYFLPEAQNDFIFAVLGEEGGLKYTLAVVGVFGAMFVAGIVHLRRAPNLFQFLVAAGCVFLISFQALINLASVTGLIPPKGMSLPFISAGISNLLLMGILMGILLNTQRTWGRAALPQRGGSLREVMA
jgi:cell division protein FtsW